MPDIVLKDRNGNDITYPGINSIKVRTTNGDKRTFVHGEMVEKTVAPDFSEGDVEIKAADDTFISKVTIEKPEDLLPENIREGKEIGGVVGSAFVVDVVKTAVFEEQEVALTMLEGIPMPFVQMNTDATLAVGETYTVTWNGTEYVCVAAEVDGLVLFGNAMVTGGEDDGVPFACQFVSSELTGGDAQLIIMSMYDTTDVTYTVGISQKTREDVETAEVELALADGDQEVTPSASDKVLTKVTIKKPETLTPENIAKDVEIAGVVGSAVTETEEATVELDFSNGAIEVTPTEDKTLSKVNIPVPETLIPENIAEGVDIAGIIGTLAAGGGGRVVSVTQKATPTSNTFTLTHGLGVVPDIVFVANTSLATTIANSTLIAIGRSTAAKNAGVAIPNNHRWYRSNTYLYCAGNGDKCIDTDDTSVSIPIINANEETVTFNRLATTEPYEFFCIGGLT